MNKLLLLLIMLLITVNLMAFKKTKILEYKINNTKITRVETNDDKLGLLEEIKIELKNESIQKKYKDDGVMGYEYFINEIQVLKSELALFAMGICYNITQAFGITIISKSEMQEEGYEPEAYFKMDKELLKKDYKRIEYIAEEITEDEYNQINNNISTLIENKGKLIVEKIEIDTNLKIEEIEELMSEKF
ncbi:MAG: hypothetical protein ACRCZO_09630 [Cetobacterium sp.]